MSQPNNPKTGERGDFKTQRDEPLRSDVQSIFLQALKRPDAEREAFVHSSGLADTDLTLVLAMIRHTGTTGDEGLLDAQTGKIPLDIVGDSPSGIVALQAALVEVKLPERLGTHFDGYTLIKEIGVGGYGVVYAAEQRDPARRVAVKIIKLGMDTRQVLTRFEQERQALAVMDHPGIAKVYGAGATPSGKPYFVMELVDGKPITTFADEERLTIRERLELLMDVCDAVQHAHFMGIIHRDIKPANVLASRGADGSARVKLIDFGVAKAIRGKLASETIETQTHSPIGTLQYMAPEQCGRSDGDTVATEVDTRADVYALGVLLYELLTGTPPLNLAWLRTAPLVEVLRVASKIEPVAPSVRASTEDVETTLKVARDRRELPGSLVRALRGELDCIAQKAIDNDRLRRYQSPAELAADIQRHLAGEAVLASPPSQMYRFRKWMRRRRFHAIAGAVVALSLAAGFATTLWQAREAARQRDAAQAETKRADRNAESEAKRLEQYTRSSEFQTEMFRNIDPTRISKALYSGILERYTTELEKQQIPVAERSARTATLRAELSRSNMPDVAASVIDQTILKPALDAISKQFGDDPVVAAQLHTAIGGAYMAMGLYTSALPLYEQALDANRRTLGDDDRDTLTSIHNLALVYLTLNDLPLAERHIRDALNKRRRILGEDRLDTLRSLCSMGVVLYAQKRYADAEPYLTAAYNRSLSTLGDDHQHTLTARNNLASLYHATKRYSDAERLYRDVLDQSTRLLGPEHPDTLNSMNNLAVILLDIGSLNDAESLCGDVIRLRQEVLGGEHPTTLESKSNMATILVKQKRIPEAIMYLKEVLRGRESALGPGHQETNRTRVTLGDAYAESKEFLDAMHWYSEALAYAEAGPVRDMSTVLDIRLHLAQAYFDQDKYSAAETHTSEALRLITENADFLPERVFRANYRHGIALMKQEKLERSCEFLIKAAALARQHLKKPEDYGLRINVFANTDRVLQRLGRHSDAEPYLREALALGRSAWGDSDARVLTLINNLGLLLFKLDNYSEAESLFREAVSKHQIAADAKHERSALQATSNLAMLLSKTERYQEAISLLLPVQSRVRVLFIDSDSRVLASVLKTLGRSRAALGYDSKRFASAEAELLEAHQLYMAAKDRGPMHEDTLDCVQQLINIYTVWHTAEPGTGYDTKAAEWKAKLDTEKPTPKTPTPALD